MPRSLLDATFATADPTITMFTDKFIIKNHIFAGQHVRQHSSSAIHKGPRVHQLHAKQYISYSNQDPQDGDLTIIALHGVGMFKELYEPMWEDLCETSERQGLRIRSIWMIDASDHGHSAVLNEGIAVESVDSRDYALDVLAMINSHRDEMPSPLVGFGHSEGALALAQLSNMHPRLFSSLIFVDPLLDSETNGAGNNMPKLRDVSTLIWDDDAAALKYARARFTQWSPRVLQKWKQFGLHGLPTRLSSDVGRVTLKTARDIQDWSMESSNLESLARLSREHNKWLQNDGSFQPFQSASAVHHAWPCLAHLRPSTHYFFPIDSPFSSEAEMQNKIMQTRHSVAKHGKAKKTRVTKVLCAGGHLAPMEKPRECAVLICERLIEDRDMREDEEQRVDSGKDTRLEIHPQEPDRPMISFASRASKL